MFTTPPSKNSIQIIPHPPKRQNGIDFGKLTRMQNGILMSPLQMPGVEITHTFSNLTNADVMVWKSRVPAGEHYFPPCDKYMLSVCLSDIPHGIWYHGGRTLAGHLKVSDLLIKGVGSSAYHNSDFASNFLHLGLSTQYLQAVMKIERKAQRLDLGEFLGLQDNTLNSLISTLHPALCNAFDLSPSFIDTVARAVCLHLKQQYQPSRLASKGLNDAGYDAVIAYLSDHTDRTTSVAEIACNIGMDATQLSRLYKQRTGDTLGKLGLQMRLAKACEMLQTRGSSATHVAMATGFNDLPHFSRHFKKHYGISPSSLLKH